MNRRAVLVVALAGCGRVGFDPISHTDAPLFGGPDACALAPSPANQRTPAVAGTGDHFVVAWDDDRSGTGEIWAARVTPSGAVLDPTGFPIASGGTVARHRTAIAGNDTQAYVAWREDSAPPGPDVYGALLVGTQVGTVSNLSAGGFAAGTTPSVATNNDTFAVAWGNQGAGAMMAVARVTAAGTADVPFIPCNGPNGQAAPSITFGAGHYFVAWVDGRVSPADIFFTRLGDLNGLDCLPITDTLTNDLEPTAGFANGSYTVAWRDEHDPDPDVYGTVITTAGVVSPLNGNPVTQTPANETGPKIAATTTHVLVTWLDMTANAVRAALGDTATNTLGTPFTLPTLGGGPSSLSIAAQANEFLVVAETAGATTGQDLEGWFVSNEGIVHGPFTIVGTCN